MGKANQREKTLKYNFKIIISLLLVGIFLVMPVVLEIAYNFGFIPNSPTSALLDAFDADAKDGSTEFVEFFRVGQGDCTIVKSGDMAAVIDFGEVDEDNSIYRRLLQLGITKLDLAVITHHHSDHLGGFTNLLKNMTVDRLLISDSGAKDANSDMYKEAIYAAKSVGTKIYRPKVGGKFKIGKAELQILYLDETAEEENNRSIITILNMGGKRILFTGDAETSLENKFVEECNLDCDILKMGHHGSYTSTGYKLLESATPKVAIASCGYDNMYKHPSQWAVERLEKMGVTLYRTDLDRSIRCTFNQDGFSVLTQSENFNG